MIVEIHFLDESRGLDLWCGEFESEAVADALVRRLNRDIVYWAPKAYFVVRLMRGCY